jgi:hypothetical protein
MSDKYQAMQALIKNKNEFIPCCGHSLNFVEKQQPTRVLQLSFL